MTLRETSLAWTGMAFYAWPFSSSSRSFWPGICRKAQAVRNKTAAPKDLLYLERF